MLKFRHFSRHFPQIPVNKWRCGNPFHLGAPHLFDEISQRDISSLNCTLNSCMRNGDAVETWNLFLNIHSIRSDVNSYTFTPVLRACSALLDPTPGLQVHALMIKLGLDTEVVTKTALIDMYSKYGQLGNSVCLFDEMSYRDVVAWNAMLSIYLRHGLPLKAIDFFRKMRGEKVEFNEFTLCSVLKACASLKAYQQGKQIHGLIIVMGRDLVVLSTALIDFYSNLGQIDEAMKIYHNLSWQKDDIIFNSLISGCVRNKRFDVAVSLMKEIKPNVIALTSALAACSDNSDMWIGKQVHGVVIRQGFTNDTQLCNALLDMYAKCGKIRAAALVFERICRKDVVCWTSMIDAYGSHGRGAEALDLFEKMGNEVLPNTVTFLAVLSACGHSGLVEQGRECFYMVQDRYGLEPGPEHYACLIDVLGRAGYLEDIYTLLHHMVDKGIKSSGAVWSALLNACRTNEDILLGEFAAKQILQLQPNNPGNYVSLSNFYASTGRWDAVDELRTILKKKGIAKGEGSSWVTLASSGDDPLLEEESESAAMFRAFSTRGGRGYEKLSDEQKESSADISLLNEAKMSRARSVPAAAAGKLFKSATTKKQTSSDQNVSPSTKSLSKQAKKASKIHPLFSLFDFRSRKKATANPEFSRYIQYLKEGGILNANSNKPTIN